MDNTYAAVDAKISALFALLRSPTLPPNRTVKIAIRPSLSLSESTTYKMVIGQTRSTTARKVLSHATKRDSFWSEV